MPTDLSEIKSVTTASQSKDVNFYLSKGGVILSVGHGTYEDGGAYALYSIGFKVPKDEQPDPNEYLNRPIPPISEAP